MGTLQGTGERMTHNARSPKYKKIDRRRQATLILVNDGISNNVPTLVTVKARSMPTHERLGPDDRENLQD
jgi:hypothetical protein